MSATGSSGKGKETPVSVTPTMEALAKQIEALTLDTTKRFQDVGKTIDDKADLVKAVHKKKAKIAMPTRYNGDSLKLKAWISQCRAYYDYYLDQFEEEEDKVLFCRSTPRRISSPIVSTRAGQVHTRQHRGSE
ncbi:hypothetical protein V8F06_014300 [Rhypophila decipiens]